MMNTFCIQHGNQSMEIFISIFSATSDLAKKTRLREKIEEYLKRAEELKKHVQEQKEGLIFFLHLF